MRCPRSAVLFTLVLCAKNDARRDFLGSKNALDWLSKIFEVTFSHFYLV
jgi:hypothetical protein